jgi:predicted TIM-barrel fold metal-dependent hydrolase
MSVIAADAAGVGDVLISADSHVLEDPNLWVNNLPAKFRSDAPKYPQKTGFEAHVTGRDPAARSREMAEDGVSAEILYPSLMLDQFSLEDAALQEACFRVYNDWIAEFCAHAPAQLFSVAALSVYNIDNAVAELQRCVRQGARGVMIWEVPPSRLSFATDHYERLWAAAQEANVPISLHIITGEPFKPIDFTGRAEPTETFWMDFAVNKKLLYATNALKDFIGSGVLERFPRLKLVFVENEISWMPYVLSQYDKYAARPSTKKNLTMLPSEYARRQVYATFFNDPPSRWILGEWGEDTCMWSNDFPHPNSTWPKSREVIARDLGHISPDRRRKLLSGNVKTLYGLS